MAQRGTHTIDTFFAITLNIDGSVFISLDMNKTTIRMLLQGPANPRDVTQQTC